MPKSNIFVKTESVLFNRLQSILLKVLRKVYLSLVILDSIPWPQLHQGFKDSWKLCFNLCSLKLVKQRRKCIISFVSLWLWQLYKELAELGLIKWTIFFLNVRKLSELRRLGSSLFHSEIVDRKNEFLKKLCFDLKMGRFCTFFFGYWARLTGTKWKIYSGSWFLNIL